MTPPFAPSLLALFALSVLVEIICYRSLRRQDYPWKEAWCSAAVGLVSRISGSFTAPFIFKILSFHQALGNPAIAMDHPLHWVLLFFSAEFFYYWFHRYAHSIPLMWASHSVHHSTTRLNFLAAQRLSIFPILGAAWVFLLPLIWMGFPVNAVVFYMTLNLLHQFFLHTELVPKLRRLEFFWNTPSHHRVHHDRTNGRSYKNFGGTVIIFDRLFNTFEAETDHPYVDPGKVPTAFNPIRATLDGWRGALLQAVRQPTWLGRVRYLVTPQAPPRRR